MDPFHDIDPLMGDNPTTVETNLDAVYQLDQIQLYSFRNQRDNDGYHKARQEIWEPEDYHSIAFDFDDEQSLQNIKYFLDSLYYDRKNDVYNLKIS